MFRLSCAGLGALIDLEDGHPALSRARLVVHDVKLGLGDKTHGADFRLEQCIWHPAVVGSLFSAFQVSEPDSQVAARVQLPASEGNEHPQE
jgi:hypothetical protein